MRIFTGVVGFRSENNRSDAGDDDKFGTSCDIDDLSAMMLSPVAIVSAEDNDVEGESNQGAAYMFEEEQIGTIKIVKETIPAGIGGDFGFEGSGNFPIGNP